MPNKIDIPDETVEEMCDLFRNGSSIPIIMSKYGLSRNKITKTLRDHLKDEYEECAKRIIASCAAKAAPKLRGRVCKRTPEWTAKIALSNKGKKRSTETRQKISKSVRSRFQRGTWTKEQHTTAMKKAIETKRKNGYFEVHSINHSLWMIKNAPMRGKTMSEESKQKMREAKNRHFSNGGTSSQFGIKRSKEQKLAIGMHTAMMWKSGKFLWNKSGHWRSKLEIQAYDQILKIFPDAKHSFIISNETKTYVFDVYVPSLNLLIEINGDYWHLNPQKYKSDYIDASRNVTAAGVWAADAVKRSVAVQQGFKIITVWEADILSQGIENVFNNALSSVVSLVAT